jgi:DNA polymerase (family 10)
VPAHNAEIAEIFNTVADLLEIQGANPFRVRAYRNAARTVSDQGQSMAEKVERGEDLSRLPGIRKDLAAKITEIVNTRSHKELRTLLRR